ncbi:DUF1360 domain-containing protein [Cytobacillus sp. Hz8]|uniref:DUF1360 domain-containing protein n=1 Tax=Cytobacillus sp. Hz8 TaxID=3347168 RepID=UPI0035D8973D
MLDFILLALASFRLTRLIVYDKITAFLRAPFFDEMEEENESGEKEIYFVPKKTPIRGFIGELLGCYWCTGIWSAMILYSGFLFWPTILGPVLVVLAVAGLAAIVETIIQLWMS